MSLSMYSKKEPVKARRRTLSRSSGRRSHAGSSAHSNKHAEKGAGTSGGTGGRGTGSSNRRGVNGTATGVNSDSDYEDNNNNNNNKRSGAMTMMRRTGSSDLDLAGGGVDIMDDDQGWDTDLEREDTPPPYDGSGKTVYLAECRRLGVIPVSYFIRHMDDPHLTMRHHGLAASGIRAIAPVLMFNNTVVSLDLTDNWLGYEGGITVCEMLKENCFITELNLSDNRLKKCAAELCRTLSLNDNLRRVTLAGNGFDDRCAQYLAEFIMVPTRVEFLDLSRNSLCEAAGLCLGPAISDNVVLKELDLSWNHLRRRGAMAVAAGVKTNVMLKKLNLSWNGFAMEGALALGAALKDNAVLEELNIANNRINTEGAVLIGKGLSSNETLHTLKMGKNPMQSAGCWGICAAVLKNPNSVLKELDFTDILVNPDFEAIFKQVQEQLPGLRVAHGGCVAPLKPKARVHPIVKLMTFIDKSQLRLVDFFNKFDSDGSMSITRDQFRQGIQEAGMPLTEEDLDLLLAELDKDGDGEINYSELVIGHTDFQERDTEQMKVHSVVTTLRPVTS